MKKHLLTALMLLIVFKAAATEIIVIMYPERVLLGVDSRIGYVDRTGKKLFLSGCKIFETNNIVYAFAGYAGSYGNYGTGHKNFNTQQFVGRFLERRDKPLIDNLKDLQKGLAKELTKEFDNMKKVDPANYLIEKQKGNPLSLVVLSQNINGPFICSFDATFDKSSNKIKVYGSISQNSREIRGFGAAAVVNKYHKADPDIMQEERVVANAINFSIRLTAKGINWIRKNSY